MYSEYYTFNIILLILAIPLLYQTMDKKELVSPLNLILAYMYTTLFVGYILLPVALLLYRTNIYADKFAGKFNTYSFWMFYLSFVVFCFVILFMQKSRTRKKEKQRLIVNQNFIIASLLFLTGMSFCLLMLTFGATKVIPLFTENPLESKYFTANTNAYLKFRPFYTAAINILIITASIGGYYFLVLIKKRRGIFLLFSCIFIASLFMLALTMKRGPLLMPIIFIIGAAGLAKRIKPVSFILLTSSILTIGIALWFIRNSEIRAVPFVYGISNNFFVEIREFGTLLNRQNGETDYASGLTYVAGAASLVPTKYLPLKEKYHIGRLTMRLMNIDPDSSGAPRIGMVGEAYLNWGIPGVIFISGLFAVFIAYLQRKYYEFLNNENRFLWMLWLFFVFMSVGFAFYTSGSACFLMFIFKMIFIIPIYLICYKKIKINSKKLI